MGNGWSNRQKKRYRTTPGFFQLEESPRDLARIISANPGRFRPAD